MRIGILEDDPAQAAFVNKTLSANGHVCHEFSNGQTLVRTLRRETFDLLVLDWAVPGTTGEEVLRWVRQRRTGSMPVIFMTARNSESDIASILNAGADDYMIKPVSASVLLARVSSLLRRVYTFNPTATREVFGDVEFDLLAGQVLQNGAPVPLTLREFTLALLLFQNMGRPLAREHILDIVWNQTTGIPSRTMDTHISLLRAKLGLRPENGYSLTSIYGFGYRLEQIGAGEADSQGSDGPRMTSVDG